MRLPHFIIASTSVCVLGGAAYWMTTPGQVPGEAVQGAAPTAQVAAVEASAVVEPDPPPAVPVTIGAPVVPVNAAVAADAGPATAPAPSGAPVTIKPTVERSPEARELMRAAVMSRRAMGAGGSDLPTPGMLEGQPEPPEVNRQPALDLLRRGTAFDGDLRNLPQTRPRVRERPERDELQPNPGIYTGAGVPSVLPTPPTPPVPSAPAPATTVNFDGADFALIGTGHPPDTNGDVGPNHIIETVNTGIAIFNKAGGLITSFSFDTFMSQGTFGNLCDTDNFGDPVVVYDTFEDRWVISDFAFQLNGDDVANPPGVFECFAVSKTGDPVSGGWNFYSINTQGGFGDYPKLGIWPDGLYVTFNMYDYAASGGFQNVRLYAMNKAQMYAGAPAVQVVSFDLPSDEFTVLPANARLQTGTPPVGSPNYFASVWKFLDTVTVWKFSVDWAQVANSTLTGPFESGTTTSWGQLTAPSFRATTPANAVDTMYPRLMMQNQYSNISGVESLWNSHTVGAATPTSALAAPRFYQVKVTGGTVEAVATQAFTYAPVDTLHRFMPSVAVNKNGDLAIGYNTSNAATNPAIVYAGRLAGDAANTITLTEATMVAGGGSQNVTNRWGDYSTMTLDPDGCHFWFFGEYYAATGGNWNTRVGSFTFPGCTANTSGNLLGIVRNTANLPIAGVTVRLGARTTTTNAVGAYEFSGLPSGTYPTITASHPGHTSSTATNIAVPSSGNAFQDLTLSPAPKAGCFQDTSQSDFSSDTATDCDLTTSPGDVQLANVPSIDQQNTAGTSTGTGFDATSWTGQTFIPAVTGLLVKADVKLFCNGCGATPPDLTLSVRATSGGLPTGADLATATVPGSVFASGFTASYTASFGVPATLTSGTQYALILRPVSAPAGSGYFWIRSSPSTYANGQRVLSGDSGASWSADSTRDFNFKTYMESGYSANGTLISSIKDGNPMAGSAVAWDTIGWGATVTNGTSVSIQVAASNSINGPFDFVGPDGTAGTFFTNGGSLAQFNGKRYLRYKAVLATPNPAFTPVLNFVRVCFSTFLPGVYLNEDGSGDVFLYNMGNGAWQREVTQAGGTFTTAAGSWNPDWTVIPAKFNEDFLTDFFLFNTASGQWFKMLNDGGSGFTTQAMDTWWNGWQRFVMDLDGDGISDVFLWDPVSGVWFKAISTPTGFTYFAGSWTTGWEVVPMTLNNDAMGDLFLINRTSGLWFWVLGAAGATFTYPASEFWYPLWVLRPGDFNADGLTDLILHDPPTGAYFVALNTGAGFSYTGGYWSLGRVPYVGDFNADGAQDVFLHNAANGQWVEMLSNGTGGFAPVGSETWSLGWQLHLTDLNSDGRTDIVLYHPTTGVWYQARNLVNGTFTYTSGNWGPNWVVIVRTPFF